jgi:hypothetical protein
MARPTASSLR